MGARYATSWWSCQGPTRNRAAPTLTEVSATASLGASQRSAPVAPCSLGLCPLGLLFKQEAPGTIRTVLVITDERFLDHDTGSRHPERPDRLRAALAGVTAVDSELLSDGCAPRRAERSELELVHRPEMIDRVVTLAEHGGGHLDADTPMGAASLDAALLAAGAVLSAAEQLGAEGSDAEAYCIVRPPGHHATPEASMGFCLFNSVAVAAAALAATGQRVAIVDVDAHHGNGTQDIFYRQDDVLYASIHQYRLYPGTGALAERGVGPGEGSTINVPAASGCHRRGGSGCAGRSDHSGGGEVRPRLAVDIGGLRRASGRPPHRLVLLVVGLRRLRPPADAAGTEDGGGARGWL